MRATRTLGKTHTFKPPLNWNAEADGECGDLEVRVQLVGETKIVELVSTWKPTPEELEHLNLGGVIEIGLMQATQPPMCVYVTDPVKEA